MEIRSLCTPAWLLRGMAGSTPGLLQLRGGRLRFMTDAGPAFDAPLTEVSEATFPWYYFGGGARLRIGGDRYRVSFVRPNGGMDPPSHLADEVEEADTAGSGLEALDIGRGRRVGAAWREALAPR